MKMALCFLTTTLFGIAFAQENYVIESDTGSTIVQVYPNVLVGRTLVRLHDFLPSDEVSLESFPYQIEDYSFNGIDSTGTLHIGKSVSRQDDDYEVSSIENYVFGSTSITLPAGSLDGPRLEINVEDIGNGEMSITLTNAEELEPFNE